MDEKILFQDLSNGVSARSGLSKKDSDSFVREFFQTIEQFLQQDRIVKVKGLGTFKIVEVSGRDSVNVNTGERIHIEGHSKVTYTPDSTIRDYVNRPFAEFETIILNEGVDLSAMEYIDTTDNTDDDTSDGVEDDILENVADVPSIESKEEGDSDRRSVDIGSSEIVEEDKQPVVADDDVNPTVNEDDTNPVVAEDGVDTVVTEDVPTVEGESYDESEVADSGISDEDAMPQDAVAEESDVTVDPAHTDNDIENENSVGVENAIEGDSKVNTDNSDTTDTNVQQTIAAAKNVNTDNPETTDTTDTTDTAEETKSEVSLPVDSKQANATSSDTFHLLKKMAGAIFLLFVAGLSYYAGSHHWLCSSCEYAAAMKNDSEDVSEKETSVGTTSGVKVSVKSETASPASSVKDSVQNNGPLEPSQNKIGEDETAGGVPSKEKAETSKIQQNNALRTVSAGQSKVKEQNRNVSVQNTKPGTSQMTTKSASQKTTQVSTPATRQTTGKSESVNTPSSDSVSSDNTTKFPQVRGAKYQIVGVRGTHVVESGEGLFSIARKEFGSMEYTEYIMKLNNITNPDHIEVGQVLKMPELEKK